MGRIKNLSLITAAGIFFSLTIFAGGPLQTWNGKSVRFQSNTITYKLDRGAFGIFTNTQARDLANASFKVWDDVSSSNVTFQHTDADTLPVDVDGTNFLDYTNLDSAKIDGINPIVFDSDGSITDALFGSGASADVIGFAYSEDRDSDGYLDEGEAFMNGKFADGSTSSFTLAEWKSTFVHEFGHFLGLDHTQINGNFVNDGKMTQYIPTMYPTATVNDVPLGDLNPDDIAAISALYPEPAFATSTGNISGSVTRANGSVVRGANVIAISTGADSLMNQVSAITDYYVQNNGNYTVVGLTPGSYVIRIEPIDPDFTGGSSVGPYSYDFTDLSFINPVTPEYYNGINESGDPAIDNPMEKTSIIVSAGTTTSNVDVIANGKGTGVSNLLTEDFNFSGLLTANGWTAHSGTTNQLLTTTGLIYPGFISSGVGNAVLVSNLGGEDVNKGFDEQSTNGSTIYCSLLLNVNDAATTKSGDYFFHIGDRTSSTSFSLFSARLFAKITGNVVNFGISNTNTVTYASTNFSKNTTYLVITKYTINTAGNDEIKLWVFSSSVPSSEVDAGTPAATNALTAGQDVINAVGIRQGSATSSVQVVIDAINISTTWPTSTTTVKSIPLTALPTSVELLQNYPNPFNPTTSIRFALPSSEMVKLKVFDLLGREIAQIAEGQFEAGVHEARFDAHQLSSGAYFYSLEAGTHREMKKMILMK
jgi:hypothetical protein